MTAWGPIPVDGSILSSTANHTGDVAIKPYGMVTLDMPDKSSRNMETSQEISITFQVENDGNDVDTIDIRITNANELTQLGFVIQSGEFIQAKDVQSDGVSEQLSFIIRAPSEAEQKFEIKSLSKQRVALTIQRMLLILTSSLLLRRTQRA